MHRKKMTYSGKFSGTIEPTPPPSWIIATYSPATHTSEWCVGGRMRPRFE